jgi:hypothetical protein
MSLSEWPSQTGWTNKGSQETAGSRSSHPGHPLPGPIQTDDGENHNPDLRQDGGSRDGTTVRQDTAQSGGKSPVLQNKIRVRSVTQRHRNLWLLFSRLPVLLRPSLKNTSRQSRTSILTPLPHHFSHFSSSGQRSKLYFNTLGRSLHLPTNSGPEL